MIRLYRIINILSLDVAVGAVISSLFFAQILGVVILPYGLAALGLTVWIIYTADHLHDASKIRNKASSYRHRFHQRYFKTLLILMVIAMCIDIVVIFFIKKQVFFWGLGLIVLIALYLITQRKLFFLKEFFVALMYTIGVLLPSFAVTSLEIDQNHYTLFFQFFLLALLNLLIFSLFDADKDSSDGLHSFVTHFGKPFVHKFIFILFLILAGINLFQIIKVDYLFEAIIILLMGGTMFLIFVLPKIFVRDEYYRMLGDAIFFLPVLTLL
jgi:4-hydroxybenzoate polyprenyltransferase